MLALNLNHEDWSNVKGERTDSQLEWAPLNMSIVLDSLEPDQFPDEFEYDEPLYGRYAR